MRKAARFGERRNWEEWTVPTKLTYLRSDLVGGALLSLVLLAISPAPAASDPRLLWRANFGHG